MEVEEVLQTALAAAEDKKATEPMILDTRKLTPIFDYFLICSAATVTHVRAIAEHLREVLEGAGLALLRREGGGDGRWILLDYGWFVVHIMLQTERDFYQIERLWHDAERILGAARSETR